MSVEQVKPPFWTPARVASFVMFAVGTAFLFWGQSDARCKQSCFALLRSQCKDLADLSIALENGRSGGRLAAVIDARDVTLDKTLPNGPGRAQYAHAEETLVVAMDESTPAAKRSAAALETRANAASAAQHLNVETRQAQVRNAVLAVVAMTVMLACAMLAAPSVIAADSNRAVLVDLVRFFPDGGLVLVKEETIEECSVGLAEMFGYGSAAELRGRPVHDFVPNPAAHREKMLNHHGPITRRPVVAKSRDGRDVPVLLSVTPLADCRFLVRVTPQGGPAESGGCPQTGAA